MNEDYTIDIEKIINTLIRRKKFLLSIFLLTFIAGASYTLHKRIFKPQYKGSFSLLIKNPIRGSDKEPKDGILDFSAIATNKIGTDVPTLKSFLKSPIIIADMAKKNGESTKLIKKNIDIELGGDRKIAQGILKISYIGSTPEKVERILNDLSQTYVNVAGNERKKQLSKALDFLDAQFPILKSKQERLEEELADFRLKYGVVDPRSESLALRIDIKNSESDLIKLIEIKTALNNLKTEIGQGKFSAVKFNQSINLGYESSGGINFVDSDETRFYEIREIEEQLSKLRTKYKSSSTMVISVKEKLDSLKPELIKIQMNAVDKALLINKNSIELAETKLKELKKSFKDKPDLIKEYERIRQFLEISRLNLSALIKTKEKFQIEIAQTTSPWQILTEMEVNQTPYSPNLPKSLILIIVVSTFVSVFITLLRDRLDDVYHSPREIEDNLNEIILGSIPYISIFENTRNTKNSISDTLKELDTFDDEIVPNEESLKDKQYEKFLYQESFRNLYTSIRFLDIDNPVRKILITSSLPKEGKSLINIILAKTLADIGLKVLLIDADMRKPQIHERLGLNNILGLSNLLIDKQGVLKKMVQKVKGIDNLDILTSGRKVPDTTRLLRSERMKELMNNMDSESYDYIIIDPPPVLGLSDASLLSPLCDGTILIVSLENVNKKLPLESIKKIKKTSSLLGLITNGSINTNKSNKDFYTYESYAADAYMSWDEKSSKSSIKESKFIFKIFDKFKNFLIWIDK
tara:strand:+ start:1222 stop:3471 length:2250 start_codon:yes stop_codon:yes gene_type:complete